jgi:hypothetical protein
MPLDWAMTQNNLGIALSTLGQRESGTARLEQAVAAWDACLTVTASVWPSEWVDEVRSRRDKAQADILHAYQHHLNTVNGTRTRKILSTIF